jgi:hypothetical protein
VIEEANSSSRPADPGAYNPVTGEIEVNGEPAVSSSPPLSSLTAPFDLRGKQLYYGLKSRNSRRQFLED